MSIEDLTMLANLNTSSNPFPGLRPFNFHESHLFFGRDEQCLQLLHKLNHTRFVTIVGASGSGKSSLVRAGLLPELLGAIADVGDSWRVAVLRPGSDPIGNLALALNDKGIFGSQTDEEEGIQAAITETTLRRSSLGLIESVRQARLPAHENLLIVVDQFEEIFRFAQTAEGEADDDAAAFTTLLIEAAHQKDFPIYVVLTMRSDYLGHCAQFRDLPEAINEGHYLIPRMTRDECRQAITGPVAVGHGTVAEDLVNQILMDITDVTDQLPILQHALARTWSCWVGAHQPHEPMSLHHYNKIGRIYEALSLHADEAYNELPDERSKLIAEKLFKHLTYKGPDNREIRSPSTLKEVCAVTEASQTEVAAVVECFRCEGRSFLMPPPGIPLHPESFIDISHESLIRGWETLKRWVDEEAESAKIYRRLAETAVLYQQGKAGLWSEPDLTIALRWREQTRPNQAWAQRYSPNFEEAMNFLSHSHETYEMAALQKETLLKRASPLNWLLTIGISVLFIISLALALYANQQRKEVLLLKDQFLRQKEFTNSK